MAYNPKFNKRVKNLTTSLVNHLTSFKEGTENYDSCMEFALSNFYYHRFLDVDGHKINQQLKGLCEKFLIYSQPVKSQCFKELTDVFLSSDLTDTSFSQSQTHYRILSILLNLSDNPVNKPYVEKNKLSIDRCGNTFDWTAYLLEGEDEPKVWSWDASPLLSEDDDDEEGNYSQVAERFIVKKNVKSEHVMSEVISTPVSDCSDLGIVQPYWKSTITHLNRQEIFTALSTLKSQTVKISASENVEEYHILREILWLLCGWKNLYVFPEDNNKHTVCEKMQLSHQTSHSVENTLSVFAKCGKDVTKLKAFAFSKQCHESLTYEAFAVALLAYFKWMESDLLIIEKKLLAVEETILLGDLKEMVKLHVQIIQVLSQLFDCTVGADQTDETCANCTSRFLGALYAVVVDELHLQSVSSTDKVEIADVLMFMWLCTIQPYVNIIDKWVSSGELDDPKEEFVFQRLPAMAGCEDVNFWKDAVSNVVNGADKLLPWLQPFLAGIISGGKSMEIVKTLSVLSKKNSGLSTNLVKEKLYDNFTNMFKCLLHGEKEFTNQVNIFSSNSTFNRSSGFSGDSLLSVNFQMLFGVGSIDVSDQYSITKLCRTSRPFPLLIHRSLQPFLDLKCNYASNRLLETLKSDCGLSQTLELFQNFHLMAWGDVMHSFCTCLFQQIEYIGGIDGDLVGLNVLLHDAVAEKVDDTIRMYVTLKDANKSYTRSRGLLETDATLPQGTTESSHILLSVTDSVVLQYTVDWPINLVLNDESISVYQMMFSYLMQIKRAVYSVESLKFSSVYRVASTSSSSINDHMTIREKAHRLSILRIKMLHLLRHWQSFVMTSVIHVQKQEFMEKFDKAKNLDDVLAAHQNFLHKVTCFCLLDSQKHTEKLVQETLKKIMLLALTLNMLWRQGVSYIHSRNITKHESDFHECSEFLQRILKTIATRGAVPILDALANSILPA